MRIAVVGAGAMGSLVAARLALAGSAPTLLGRASPHLEAVRRDGLVLEEADGNSRTVPLRAGDDPALVAGSDLVIVLVKAWATAAASAPLRPHLDPDATLLTLQNGLGNAAAIRAALGNDADRDVALGVTSQAALRTAPGVVRHAGTGPTVVGREDGEIDARLRQIAGVMTAAGLATVAVRDVERWVWRKLAVNAAINGLTALAGVPNGEIVASPELRAAASVLANEVETVARARGLEIGDVEAAVAEVAAATAGNRSSMLTDLERGDPTEVEAIHGAVVRAGEAVGVNAPANRVVAALIRARTRASTTIGAAASDEDRDR